MFLIVDQFAVIPRKHPQRRLSQLKPNITLAQKKVGKSYTEVQLQDDILNTIEYFK